MVALSLNNLTSPETALGYNNAELSLAATLGLPTTTWQPGGVERTIFAVMANIQAQSDVAGSIIAQAGFLDFAATGFVTYTDATGQVVTLYVTPDPSVPSQNPTGALGWLDVLADSLYNVQRILAAFAGGTLALVNASPTTYGSFTANTYHVAQPGLTGSPTYANSNALSIPPSVVVATVAGASDNGSGLIQITTVSPHNLSDGDVVALVGVNGVPPLSGTTAWEVTDAGTVGVSTTFTLVGSAFAGAWTSGGMVYTPTLAQFQADVAGTASSAQTPNVVTLPVTSLIGVTCANLDAWIGSDTESNLSVANRCRLKLASIAVGAPGGAFVYYALLAQQLAPTLSPPLEVSVPITRARLDNDATQGLIIVTIASAAGAVGGDMLTPGTDVYNVRKVLVAYVGPTTFTLAVQSAANRSIPVVLTVYLPSQYVTAANTTYFTNAVRTYFQNLPIGGVVDPGGTPPAINIVPYTAVLGSIYQAAQTASIPIQNAEGTIDGGTDDVQLAISPVPEVAVPSISISLVAV